MYIDFMGTDAAVFRSLTRRNAVRTDQHNSKWLSGEDARPLRSHAFPAAAFLTFLSLPEPTFIDAHLIPDGSDPNDSKLYFFFRERLTDNSGNTRDIHAMVARVCPVRLRPFVRLLRNRFRLRHRCRLVCRTTSGDSAAWSTSGAPS